MPAEQPEYMSERRATAWIVSAINPVLQRLRVEENYLARGAWTWRFHRRECEVLDRVADMVSPTFVDNLEDLLAKNAGTARLAAEHDQRLTELLQSLADAQQKIESAEDLRSLVGQALKDHKQAHPDEDPTGAFGAEKLPSLVAQFLINSVGTNLSPQDSTMWRFWNQHGEAYRVFLTRFRPEFDRLETCGRSLLDAVRTLLNELRTFRTGLCDRYRLPPKPVEPEYEPRFLEPF